MLNNFYKIASEVDSRFGTGAITDAATTFAYLFRRYGYASQGWDSEKALCVYCVPTTVPGAFVVIRIGGRSAFWHFSASDTVAARLEREEREAQTSGEKSEFVDQCEDAVTNCLRDLTRSVMVRDTPITVFGEPTAKDWNVPSAEVSPMAGWGFPGELYDDPSTFLAFVRWVKERGTGNVFSGMKAIMGAEVKAEVGNVTN